MQTVDEVSFKRSSSTAVAGDKPVIYFDGVCGLCNLTVDFLLKVDKKGIFQFAPLQGDTAAKSLPQSVTKVLDSVVVVDRGITLTKSDAILHAAKRIGGVYALAAVFIVVPKGLRNWVYDIVANHRYAWFGKRETCRLPSKEERSRFLP